MYILLFLKHLHHYNLISGYNFLHDLDFPDPVQYICHVWDR